MLTAQRMKFNALPAEFQGLGSGSGAHTTPVPLEILTKLASAGHTTISGVESAIAARTLGSTLTHAEQETLAIALLQSWPTKNEQLLRGLIEAAMVPASFLGFVPISTLNRTWAAGLTTFAALNAATDADLRALRWQDFEIAQMRVAIHGETD